MHGVVGGQVVGALLDCEAPDDFINNLILSVRSLLPVDALVEQVEKRNRCGFFFWISWRPWCRTGWSTADGINAAWIPLEVSCSSTALDHSVVLYATDTAATDADCAISASITNCCG